MKLELIEKKEMPLLSRARAEFKLEFDKATPKRDDIRREVAKKVGSDEKLMIVRHVYTKYGKREAKVIAHVYKNEKDMKRIEDSPSIRRNVKEEPKSEEKQEAEAPKEELKPEVEEKKAEVLQAEGKKEIKEEKPAEVKSEEKPKE